MSCIKNRKRFLPTKIITMNETLNQLFQPEMKWLRKNVLRGHKYELIFAASHIF